MAKLNSNQIKRLFYLASKAKSEGKSLCEVFESFGVETGKAKGSVRNFFYSTLKQMSVDEKIKSEYLGDSQISVGEIVAFTDEESETLLRQILSGVAEGKSVRRSILEIAKDERLALRYQNKYRNLLKTDKDRVERIKEEIESARGRKIHLSKIAENPVIDKLKREINCLCDRIARAEKLENAELKLRLKRAEEENMRLKAMLLEKGTRSSLVELFDKSGKLSL